MKFYRLIYPLLGILLTGWALGWLAGPSARSVKATVLKVATIGTTTDFDYTDHLTDWAPGSFVNEAIVAPPVSHQFPHALIAIIPAIWVLIHCPKQIRLGRISYYFFAYFRRLFGHHIAINAP
ncbi:hypothetical protein GCM10027299_51330 [Larkinella ripae]